MTVAFQRDIGSQLVAMEAFQPVEVNSSAAANGTEINGYTIDRQTAGEGHSQLFLSCKVAIAAVFETTSTATETCTVTSNFQDAATTASWADYADKDGSTQVAVTLTPGNKRRCLVYDVDLSKARRYVRLQVTPDSSTAKLNDINIGGVIVFGGADVVPPTQPT